MPRCRAKRSPVAQGRSRRGASVHRQQDRRRKGGARRRGQEGGGGIQLSLSEPRQHGADERDRALHTDKCELWCRHKTARRRSRRHLKKPACRSANAKSTRHPRRRLRPARPPTMSRRPADRQADAGHSDQAAVVARRGHAQGAYHPITQCEMTAGIDDKGNVNGIHMRISGQSTQGLVAPSAGKRNGPGRVPGLTANSPKENRLHIPNVLIDHAMRNTHMVAGFWRGVNVNHNAIYVESFIDELANELKQDPLAFRLELCQSPSMPPSSRRWRRRRLGDAGASRRLSRPCPVHGLWQLRGCLRRSLCATTASKIHRIVAATDPGTPSIRLRSNGRYRAHSSTDCPRCSTASVR